MSGFYGSGIEGQAEADTKAMDRIHQILSGTTWSSETIEWVAEVVTATGRTIEPPEEEA